MGTLFFTFDVPFLLQALEALWPRVSKGGVVAFDEHTIFHFCCPISVPGLGGVVAARFEGGCCGV